ncbi:MAG: c-type cytochrome biogenesis protein CcmI [Burkholderiales bacterium]
MTLSSPLFWALALALLAATLVVLLWPLLRRSRPADAPADRAAATAVYRDHKRQIDDDYATRTISEAERDAALADLTTRFGAEIAQDAPDTHTAGERSRWVAALALVACVPVVAGVMYFSLGNPSAMSAGARPAEHAVDDPQIAAMVDTLAKRLQANPDDAQGWALLGRSYRSLGRFDAAALAYSESAKRTTPDAMLYADWAEAVALAQGRSLAGQPTELLDKALKLEPDNPKVLALAGSAAAERNDAAAAATYWKRLRAQLPPDSPTIAQVDAALARIGESAPPASGAARAATQAAAPASAPKAQAAAPAAAPVAQGGGSVEGRVELDPKLVSSAKSGDTVFIFARDPDGSRMPLAVLKLAVADLPKSFALTDEMAMTPAATISKAAKVVIEARVSKSGNVALQPGDMTGTSAPVTPGARNVRVTIDRVVP